METVKEMRVLLAGVGGQGTILAADLLAKVAIASGLKVKLSEIHGMSQRGGAVTTVVNMGEEVHSMVISEGEADYLLAFETTEALRNIQFLREGGKLYVNNTQIKPLPVLTGKAMMPSNVEMRLKSYGAHLLDAESLASQAGSNKTANVVLLGALSTGLPFAQDIWEEQIRLKVPEHTIDINIAAFHLGRESVSA
ncbi:MAG: indolepyruvate oxidoreductase subunit beta [Eggerthellaceae bacterium]|nr:indolepyruvate oxidoreductase subunit beta [Eggerthellaceae bacterium]